MSECQIWQQRPCLITHDLVTYRITHGKEVCALRHPLHIFKSVAIGATHTVQVIVMDQEWDEVVIHEEEVNLLSELQVLKVLVVEKVAGRLDVVDHYHLVLVHLSQVAIKGRLFHGLLR